LTFSPCFRIATLLAIAVPVPIAILPAVAVLFAVLLGLIISATSIATSLPAIATIATVTTSIRAVSACTTPIAAVTRVLPHNKSHLPVAHAFARRQLVFALFDNRHWFHWLLLVSIVCSHGHYGPTADFEHDE
jgi:hypothetical protein